MEKLNTFQINNSKKLFELTKKLNQTRFFRNFLNDTQYKLLNYLIDLNNSDLWLAFLEGNCYLKLADSKSTDVASQDGSNKDKSMDGDNESHNESTTDGTGDYEDTDTEELDIEEGTKAVKRLALHIRYLLWEKAIDYYYDTKNLDQSLNTIEEVNDNYDLLDSLDTPLDEETQQDKNEPNAAKLNVKSVVREEEDDYDDEDEDEENGKPENETQQDENGDVDVPNSLQLNDDNQVILEVPIAVFKKNATGNNNDFMESNTSSSTNEANGIESSNNANDPNTEDQESLIKEFNKVYHNFEYDRETLIKRRKLEKSDLKLENNPSSDVMNGHSQGNNANNSGMDFAFATGSSLKHLLSTIQQKRDKIPLNDYELRNLFMDVKKNRGKWANDERIGQEELYDACEKVVTELRSYTEHSTPFLNKVSKREAPNYGLIIKKPMDLNTVMKKLKNLQYNSKQEFVDDIMLIWSNCLTYNADPKHFLRAHAIAMQKKSLKLIPHIPNIVIKNRTDLEKDEDKDDANNFDGNSKGKASKKGRKRTRNEEIKLEHDNTDSAVNSPDVAGPDTPIDDDKGSETPMGQTPVPEGSPTSSISAKTTSKTVGNKTTNGEASVGGDEEEEEEENEDLNDDGEENPNAQNEEDEIGPELQAWRNLTAKSRAHYCAQRAELFDESDSYKLKFDAPAIIREPNEMSNFNNYISNNEVVSRGNLLENDEPYLLEYDITGGLPGLKFKGVDNIEQDKREQKLVDDLIDNRIEQPPSAFTLSTSHGLNSVYFNNITEMQEIRKICFKISLIRQMQTQQFVHHTQMRQPEVETLKELDIDPVSKLDTHDPFSKEIQFSVLKRNISKIIMQTGFERAEPTAVNTLTQLAEKYLGNLVKSLKVHLESNSKNRLSPKEILLVSLIENGVNKPDDLYTYINEKLLNQANKLKDLKAKLSNFLKELLRPGLENFNERSFTDNSEQFMTGDFSNDLGDDFFGFKELGLDKEFNLLSSSIPIYLLHSRLNSSFSSDGGANKSKKFEDLKTYHVRKLYGSDVEHQIGLLRPFYQKLLEKSKAHFIKLQKKNGLPTDLPELDKLELVDDEVLPQKQRNIRPRLPPTGKITAIKKRPVANSFFILEDEEVQDQQQKNNNSQELDDMGLPPPPSEDALHDFSADDSFNNQAELNDEIDAKEIESLMNNLDD